jgi:hypothetical protein
LTLGAVLMLGGVNGGRSDELSSSVGVGGPSSSGAFVLPSLPENWSDMPFLLTASENVAYNSNIFAAPIGMSLNGQPRGDFTSTSSVGLSTKAYWYGQQFYFDGSFGLIRYLHEVAEDANVYSFNAGDNWTLTSRCAGTAAATLTKTPTLITEEVGLGINYATTTALTETGNCAVSNGYSLVFNSGWTKINNSNALDAVNNSHTVIPSRILCPRRAGWRMWSISTALL